MDLGAYAKIDELSQIAKDNGIDIPRLRGYRLMKYETPMPKEVIQEMYNDCEIEVIEDLCRSEPFWNPYSSCTLYSSHTDYLVEKYIHKNSDKENVTVKWDKIHGRKRKVAKFEIKKKKKKIDKQFTIWNQYAGEEDVLYIHARMGGNNWRYFEDKDRILNAPWFLDRVDDWWDGTYCDFYARIRV